jgi:ribosomal-protein-alanine N-acetyltransferase
VHRALTASDAGAVAALHAEGFARGWPASDIAQMILDPAIVGDGVAPSGRTWAPLCGFALSRIAADEAELLSIAVAAAARGRGLAGGLLGHHLARLGARGAGTLFLEVEEGNAPAIALYRRFGFAEVGRRASYYRKPDGTAAHALVMRRAMG